MIPTVGSLQKQGKNFFRSVDSIREESYEEKKRDFSRRTIVLGTVWYNTHQRADYRMYLTKNTSYGEGVSPRPFPK